MELKIDKEFRPVFDAKGIFWIWQILWFVLCLIDRKKVFVLHFK